VRIQICGPLVVERDGQRLDGLLPGRQGRLLFAYLVVNRHRQAPRDELAEALWREPEPAAGRDAPSHLLLEERALTCRVTEGQRLPVGRDQEPRQRDRLGDRWRPPRSGLTGRAASRLRGRR
jgi:hypothetical protein